MLKNKKFAFFDMDGTLIDSVGIWNQIDQKLIEKLANKTIDETTVQNDRGTQLKNSMHNQILIYVIANISRINIQLKFQLKKSSNCVMK